MKKENCRIMGISLHHLCKTTNKNTTIKEYIVVYACKSTDCLWKGKQDTGNKNFPWGG